MEYQVQLNNGQTIHLKGASVDTMIFTANLNDPKVSFVNIGDAVINKHTIISVIPVVASHPTA